MGEQSKKERFMVWKEVRKGPGLIWEPALTTRMSQEHAKELASTLAKMRPDIEFVASLARPITYTVD
jgi:hypothetical protein